MHLVRKWPIASDIALERHVGFRGTPDIVPSGAPSASVANDPNATSPDGGLLVLPDATTNLYRALIIKLAARYPSFFGLASNHSSREIARY
jgi:hypothetical protein